MLTSCGAKKKIALQQEQKIQVTEQEQISQQNFTAFVMDNQKMNVQWQIKSIDNQPFTIETQRTDTGEKIIFTGGEITINQTQEIQKIQQTELSQEQEQHSHQQEIEQTQNKQIIEKKQGRSWFLVFVFALVSLYVGYKIKS